MTNKNVKPQENGISAARVDEPIGPDFGADNSALICRFSRSGRISYRNPRFCRCFGTTSDDDRSRNFSSTTTAERQPELRRFLQRLSPQMEPAEICLPSSQNSNCRILWVVSPFRAAGKKRIEYQAVGFEQPPLQPVEESAGERALGYSYLSRVINSLFASLGEKYFESMVQHLAEVLHADLTFVGKLDPVQQSIQTVSIWGDGQLEENITYHLSGTPCQNVMHTGVCTYPSGVQELFPEDVLLQELNIAGYAGTPLVNSLKEPIGIMVALFRHPDMDQDYVRSVMQIFAARTGSELERHAFQRQLRESEENWRSLVQNIPDIVTVINPDGKILYLNRTEDDYTASDFLGKSIYEFISEDLHDTVHSAIDATLETGEAQQYETLFRGRGRDIWYSNHIGPIRRGEQIEALIIVSTDITDRKTNLAALRASEESYRALFDNASDAIYIQDREGRFLDVNQGAVQMYGYPREYFLGKTPEFVSAPGKNDLEKTAHLIQKAFRGEPQQFEFWGIRKDGDIFPKEVRLYKSTYFGQEAVIAFAQDISERKIAEETLRKQEERFRLLVENNFDLICEISADARYLYVSPNYAPILGYAPPELLGRSIFEQIHPEDVEAAQAEFQKKVGRLSYRFRHKSGRWLHIESSGKKYRDTSGEWRAVVISRDVTERERAEQVKQIMYNIGTAATTTQRVEDLYRVIQEELSRIIDTQNFFIGLYNAGDDTISLAFMQDENDRFERLPAANTISALVIRNRQSLLLTETDMEQLEQEGKIGSVGSPCKIWLGVPLIVENEVIGLIVVQSYEDEHAFTLKDQELLEFISNQVAVSIKKKQREEEIRRLSISLEQSPVSVVITDINGDIQYVNQKVIEISGYSRKELIGENPRLFKSGHMQDEDYRNLWETILSGKDWKGDFLNRKKNGELFWEAATISPIKDENGQISHFLAVKEDITERKQLLQQLYQAQKMEGIGRLAGGVAHDFNNLLTVINGSAEMALLRLESSEPVHREIVSILKAGHKAVNLTKQLLAFSRKQIYEVQVLDVNELIVGLEKMLQRLIGEDIFINTILQDELPKVKGDPTQIEQIIINLVINARDAINEARSGEKRITIETAAVHLDDSHMAVRTDSQPGEHVLIAVSDTGSGMSEDVRSKIFEPFFTTKEKSKGTGLGLSTVYGIVKQNQGNIFVYSEPGLGSTFKIYWPASDEQTEKHRQEVIEGQMLSGTETILVVEDDEGVREFTCNILEQLGYRVHRSSNGLEALEMIRESRVKPDLMITDMIMPEMNGRELADQIADVLPIARILFVSGYTDDHIVRQGALEKGIHFAHKPYSVQTIAKKVRDILDHLNE